MNMSHEGFATSMINDRAYHQDEMQQSRPFGSSGFYRIGSKLALGVQKFIEQIGLLGLLATDAHRQTQTTTIFTPAVTAEENQSALRAV